MKMITALLALLTFHAYGQHKVKTFPPNAKPGGSYTVTQQEAVLDGEELYLPEGFTINVAPDVTDLDWKFDMITWEANTTINLKRGIMPPRQGQGMPGGNAGACGTGSTGSPGMPGIPGADAANMKLEYRNGYRPLGNLWICTSGDDGGDGGNGGNGGSGGNADCRSCGGNAGNGGDGGNGGQGGRGGNTGKVFFLNGFDRRGNIRYIPMGCEPGTARPVPGPGNYKTIIVSGQPGRGGMGGMGGYGGNGGYGERCNNSSGKNGLQGGSGNAGVHGQPGTCYK